MTREIKFRTWNKKTKEMDYNPAVDGECPYVYINQALDTDNNSITNPNDVWMQYTGLKDKNGKEIYEGDIVETNDYSRGITILGTQKRKRGQVKYYEGSFIVYEGGEYQGGVTVSNNPETHNTEVIGNIYENPELSTG